MATLLAHLAKAEPVTIAWGIAIATAEEITTASLDGDILASSCSNTLSLGDTTIEVAADNEARGVLTAGKKEFSLSDRSCSAFWNEDFVEVSCQLHLPSEVDLSRIDGTNSTVDCFATAVQTEKEIPPYAVADMLAVARPVSASSEETQTPGQAPSPASLLRRVPQGVCACGGPCPSSNYQADNSNDQKWHHHEQLVDGLDCGDGTCSVGYGVTHSVTHEAAFSTGFGSGDWISAGYAVSYSHGDSQTWTCDGEAYEYPCVKHYQAYQQYDAIHSYLTSLCDTSPTEERYWIRSPVNEGSARRFYCARGPVCEPGAGYTDWEWHGDGRWSFA